MTTDRISRSVEAVVGNAAVCLPSSARLGRISTGTCGKHLWRQGAPLLVVERIIEGWGGGAFGLGRVGDGAGAVLEMGGRGWVGGVGGGSGGGARFCWRSGGSKGLACLISFSACTSICFLYRASVGAGVAEATGRVLTSIFSPLLVKTVVIMPIGVPGGLRCRRRHRCSDRRREQKPHIVACSGGHRSSALEIHKGR